MPTFVTEVETTWGSAVTPRTTGSFDVIAGDLLVIAAHKDEGTTTLGTPTNSGTAFTWTLQQSVTVSTDHKMYVWTAIATATQSMTVTGTQSAATNPWGFSVTVFRNHGGVGTSVATTVAGSGAPTLNITTTRPASTVTVFVSDNNGIDSSSRTWRTNAGALSETTNSQSIGTRVIYIGYHLDAGPIGTYAVGVSSPTGQSYHIITVEILAPHTKRPEFGSSLSGGIVQ